MKTLILILFLFPTSGFAQNTDSLKKVAICKERGHVLVGSTTTTAMYCPPYTIDTDSTTIEVTPSCNASWAQCSRCKLTITTGGQETRRVIWKRKPKE